MRTLAALIVLLVGSGAMFPTGFARDPEPLELYTLQQLSIASTRPERRQAEIVDPDGNVHLVTLGSRVGERYGEVVHIGARRIVVLQLLQTAGGDWTARTATLGMESGPGIGQARD